MVLRGVKRYGAGARDLARRGVLPLLLPALLLSSLVARPNDHGVEEFARAPQMNLPALSPDGAWLSYVEESDQFQWIVLRHLDTSSTRRSLQLDPARERVRWCGWDSAEYLLCGTVVPRQAAHRAFEESRLYLIEVSNAKVRELNRTIRGSQRDRVIDLSPEIPGSVLIEYNESNEGFPAAAELDLVSGRARTVAQSRAPIIRWISDAHHQVRIGVGSQRGRASIWVRPDGDPGWQMLVSYAAGDRNAVGPIALNAGGDGLYALAVHEGRIALIEMSLEEPNRRRVLHADPLYDVTGPLLPQPAVPELEGVRYLRSIETTVYFDRTSEALQRFVDVELPGRVNLRLQRAVDGSRELISSSGATDPPSLYLLEAGAPALRFLGHQYPQLEEKALAATQATKYRARDGQVIPAFLTIPHHRSPNHLPAVLLPHGGPETRDAVRFDPLVQFLAAQGYAVLQMNFRGSTGYGTAFAAAGAGQWGGVIHNDITDGARWLVEQGIADPERLCIVGSSFGGFAALLGATRESQWYSCAASFAGISDLLALARANDRLQYSHVWRERLGDDDRALWENSPLRSARVVETPVLLMHGTLDAVVPVRHSRRMANALLKAEREVRFLERSDCDHDMTIAACRHAWFGALGQFLGEHLQLRQAPSLSRN